ncbi:MAG: PD-(D/E)XK nuclease family protein, partial [Lachnospiraceae bacterium]|nr:PD-(D/E)XK nuclease family protein [Lachnospiraceae bacterium]
LHAQIESFFSNKPMSMSTHFCYDGKSVHVSKDVSIDEEISYFRNFMRDNSITPFRTEWHIFDMDLKIAGTIDLICRNGSHFDIYDWKRSRKASPNETVWRNGINGLEHVPDIGFYHYALQQNLYKYILEKNYGVNVDNMYIVVLHPMFGDYQKFKIPIMSKEISIIKSHIV